VKDAIEVSFIIVVIFHFFAVYGSYNAAKGRQMANELSDICPRVDGEQTALRYGIVYKTRCRRIS